MAKKTPEEIKEIIDLYTELGVYAQVAKKLGIASSTVSKYVKEAKNLEDATLPALKTFNQEVKKINEISFPTDWPGMLQLSKNELDDLKELQKEIYIN